jgi:tetratricopeptide (TPR) repeat protein
MEPATRYADRLMALSPDRYRVYYESGQAFSQAGSAYIVRMGEAFDQAIRCNPIDPEIRLGKATQLFRTGQFDKALEQADKGLALAPNLHGLQFVRGSALFQLKRYRESEAAFTQASRLLPTDFDTWLNLGVAQVLQGEKTEATQSWAQALVLRPRDVRVIDYLESLEKK